jgi:hypothetical protein
VACSLFEGRAAHGFIKVSLMKFPNLHPRTMPAAGTDCEASERPEMTNVRRV